MEVKRCFSERETQNKEKSHDKSRQIFLNWNLPSNKNPVNSATFKKTVHNMTEVP